MRLSSIVLVGLLLLTSTANAEWLENYSAARKEAIAAGQRLLVVIDKPEGRIEQVSKLSNGFEATLLEPYKLCRVDANTPAGKKLAAAFEAKSFPYTAIIDKEGRWVVYENAGKYTNSQWITMLVNHKNAKTTTAAATVADENCFT